MDRQARKIGSSAVLSEAAGRMKILGVDRLPVVEDNEIVGTVTAPDVGGAVSVGMNPTTTPRQIRHDSRHDGGSFRGGPREHCLNRRGS